MTFPEYIHRLLLLIAGLIILCVINYVIDSSKQIGPDNLGVESTVILPCKNTNGCLFEGVLRKSGNTYTLTQDDNSVITFTKFLSISTNLPK